MHCTAVWQHSSNSNINIFHNSIEHFLWNLSDFSSDNVLSCLWIVFTNSVFQVPPQKIVRRVEILGTGWQGLLVWRKISLSHGKLCLRYSSVLFEKWGECSVQEMRRHVISRTEHLNTSGIASHGIDSFRVKPITPAILFPRSRPAWLFSEGVLERQNLWRQSTDKRGHHQKRNQTDSTRNAQ